jgi:putative transcriptional regulator
MEALHEIGAVDKETMREFDESCLVPVQMMSTDEIRAARAGTPIVASLCPLPECE